MNSFGGLFKLVLKRNRRRWANPIAAGAEVNQMFD
jgi:hypothetical protein